MHPSDADRIRWYLEDLITLLSLSLMLLPFQRGKKTKKVDRKVANSAKIDIANKRYSCFGFSSGALVRIKLL